jgi:hypothetical protein
VTAQSVAIGPENKEKFKKNSPKGRDGRVHRKLATTQSVAIGLENKKY